MEVTKEFLISEGFEATSLPWRFDNGTTVVVMCQVHSHCKYDFSIISRRYDESVFKGNIPDIDTFYKVLELIKPALN